MRKLPIIIAAASTLFAFPALAAQQEIGSESPNGMSRDLGGMKGSQGQRGTYGYEREGEMGRYGEKGEIGRYGERGQAFREGCRYITVRQRRGDEIVMRHFKRCD